MRIFETSCIDSKTGKEMVLSDVSYNMAMDWLDTERKKAGLEICRVFENIKTNMCEIWTCKWSDNINNYIPTRHFYYDEERGYLLGD